LKGTTLNTFDTGGFQRVKYIRYGEFNKVGCRGDSQFGFQDKISAGCYCRDLRRGETCFRSNVLLYWPH